jgi:Flp pilus assembly pilin Flp
LPQSKGLFAVSQGGGRVIGEADPDEADAANATNRDPLEGPEMTIFAKLKNFFTDEDGAVTVDWVVLTAAIVGLGIIVLAAVESGVTNLSGDIKSKLEEDIINNGLGGGSGSGS